MDQRSTSEDIVRGALAVEAPDDAALTTLMLTVGRLGNVRTQSLRAYSASEMQGILAKVD